MLMRRAVCTAARGASPAVAVAHVPERQIFEAGGAHPKYAHAAHGIIDVRTTFVPADERGKGLAEKLCDAAFEHARSAGLRILPTCSYVSDRYIPARVNELGHVAIRRLDADTEGLQASCPMRAHPTRTHACDRLTRGARAART